MLCRLGISAVRASPRMLASTGVQRFEVVQRRGPALAARNVSVGVASYQAATEEQASTGPRVFVQYAVYKGKAAVAFKPIAPGWMETPIASKPGQQAYTVHREGCLLLEFAPVSTGQAQTQFGQRSYAWDRKTTFALKVTELSALADFADNGTERLRLFHDPNKGQPEQGTVTKSLEVSRSSTDNGYLLQLNTSGEVKTSVTVPLTRAEFLVVKQLAEYLLPRLLGFDMALEGMAGLNEPQSYQ